jgi:nitrogen fixation protein FixH
MALAYDQQTVQARSSGVDSLQQTTGQAVDAGDLIVVTSAIFNASGAVVTITDDAGQTYTEGKHEQGDASSHVNIHYKENHPGGTIKVTVDPTGGSADIDFTVSEVSGASTSGALDVAVSATGAVGAGAFTATVATGVLAQANEIIFAIASHTADDRTLTEDTADGFTLIGENQSNTAGQTYNSQYKIVASTSSVTVDMNAGANLNVGTWFICACSFKQGTATGPAITRMYYPRQVFFDV